ncbi:hypothetical protein IH979_02740 [Patescibacteria group bacterium]|nr:hypothetical protein [Patescibacteria group bacterium]
MAYRYTRLTPLISGGPTIFLLTAVGLLLGVLLSFIGPLEYSSTSRILITQELGAVDAYTASRSVERIADDLATAVNTTKFRDAVLEGNYGIDLSFFPEDETKLRKKWGKTISTSVLRSTGFLTIRAYHPQVDQAELLSLAVADVLTETGWTYTSGGNITIQLVDQPLSSRWPVRPNIFINAFSGFILGGIAGVGYILIQVERVKRRHQLIHEEE